MTEREQKAEGEPDLEYVDLVAHPELEPDLGPTPESIAQGAEPDDALYIDRGWLPDAPEPPDPLDAGYAAIQAWRAEQALGAPREPQPGMEPSDLGQSEPTPYELWISDDPEVTWADIQPGEREFCAQDAANYPERERLAGEAAAARMAELEQQAAERGLDVFGGPLPTAQARDPDPELEAG